ncbi:hydroxyacid dehydrogenase [Paenalcaligenes hominis]|uniref:hydroxyacid dehydrogenase n=1 Tax=Paenalcaligenes hominis TaxID=643674 RepID=UPI003525A5EB
MSYTVLITAPTISSAAIHYLQQANCKLLFLQSDDKSSELEHLLLHQSIDAIISRTYPLSQHLIQSSPNLKVIARHGIGYDNVDIEAATQQGIPVLVTPGTNAQGVAELCLGLILACARQIPQHHLAVRQGLWPRSSPGKELYGKTLGLVGLGRIAQCVAQLAQAINMNIIAYDPLLTKAPYPLVPSLEKLLSNSDIVSLHCPAQKEGNALINRETLAYMRSGSILINTARGQLIDELALADAIRSGHLYAAGLDTLAIEPPASNNPLLHLDRVILSPHVGGSTDQSLERTALLAAQNVLAYLQHQTINPAHLVNPRFQQRQRL